jgi:hypothetical protein
MNSYHGFCINSFEKKLSFFLVTFPAHPSPYLNPEDFFLRGFTACKFTEHIQKANITTTISVND